jgi:hypothetical protein
MERWTFDSQATDKPVNGRPDNLYEALPTDGGERGRHWEGHTRESSLYTRAAMRPGATVAIVAALTLGFAALATARRAGLQPLNKPTSRLRKEE